MVDVKTNLLVRDWCGMPTRSLGHQIRRSILYLFENYLNVMSRAHFDPVGGRSLCTFLSNCRIASP